MQEIRISDKLFELLYSKKPKGESWEVFFRKIIDRRKKWT